MRGAVQGVGFRPFVYRIAHRCGVSGWVNNTVRGVEIEVEGGEEELERFLEMLRGDYPRAAKVMDISVEEIPPVGESGFFIRHSEGGGEREVLISPDLATCPDCLKELFDPADRRYRYPFINCTQCGPRYTIILELPYDRPNTTMRKFPMCPDCQREYDDPLDRRFHAQPNACPRCGPQLALWDRGGAVLSRGEEALLEAVRALKEGLIVALKGLGGFQLLADAGNTEALRRLRERKARPTKPFALMYPNLQAVERDCYLSPEEGEYLLSPAAPILLLPMRERSGSGLSPEVAPGLRELGVMLPYTPLHHLIAFEFGAPFVATSGNVSGEPIQYSEDRALRALNRIADLFLVHDRPIARPADDSVARVVGGELTLIRRARGFAPLPLALKREVPPSLGAGPHLKATAAIARRDKLWLTPHLGDLDSAPAVELYRETISDFLQLYQIEPTEIFCDLHPDYYSTQYAREFAAEKGVTPVEVQHHLAHVLAVMVEHGLEPPVLGVSWDGTGYGLDGKVWGGEFFLIEGSSWRRVAHFRYFPLPGGEAAVREPRRTALGMLWECFREDFYKKVPESLKKQFSEMEFKLLVQMLERGVNTPLTSSVGRLFDGISALLGVCSVAHYEGEGAIRLEAVQGRGGDFSGFYRSVISGPSEGGGPLVVDWSPLVEGVLSDLSDGLGAGEISEKFHRSLIQIILEVSEEVGVGRVVLTGGCFQNLTLLRGAERALRERGSQVFYPRQIPANDGGIAAGQVGFSLYSLVER